MTLTKVSEENSGDNLSREIVYKHGKLFRSTPFDNLIDRYASGDYYGTIAKDGELLTSTSEDAIYAMTHGNKSSQDPLGEPYLVAIDASNYDTTSGLEAIETEILGPIDFSDVTIIRTTKQFNDLTGNTNSGVTEYFNRNYSRPLPEFTDEELAPVV